MRGRVRPRLRAPARALALSLLVAGLAAHAASSAAATPAAPAVPAVRGAPGAPVAPGAPQAAQPEPPRLNLAVEWRWSEAVPRRPGVAGDGSVVTSTTGATAPPQGQLTARTAATASPSALPTLPSRMVVANGGAARVRLVEAVPLQSVQAWQEPAGKGAVLVPGWAEAVQAFEVRVRWPGGRSAAEVELDLEQATPPAADGSAPTARRERLATRAWVPLDEWVTVAAWTGPGPAPSPGAGSGTTVSTTTLDGRAGRVLQLRLSALQPP
jgi:hypothetical protein